VYRHSLPTVPISIRSQRTGKEIEKHYEAFSRRLTKYIPPLLKRFGLDPDAAASVIRLEQLVKLDEF